MKKFLAFNSIIGNFEAAIFSEKSIIDYTRLDLQELEHDFLGDFLENFLKKNYTKYIDLDFLVFFNGPSSFIKIRNGISHALGIKFALCEKIQLLNFNLFEIYNYKIRKNFQIFNKSNEKLNSIIVLKGFGDSVFVEYFDIDLKEKNQRMIKFSDFLHFLELSNFFDQNIKFFFNESEILQKILLEFERYANENSFISQNKKNFFLENHFLFDSQSLIFCLCDLIFEKSHLGEKFDESFYQIKPFYLFNPQFQKISEKKIIRSL